MQRTRDRRCTLRKNDVVAWFLLFSLPEFVIGQPKDPPGPVDKLATSNPPATIQGEPGRERATRDKFDLEESKRINTAVAQVIRRSEELWPELVKHLSDDRYSKTVGIDAGYPRNWSVGDICQDIIGTTLSAAYYRHLQPGTKQSYHRFHIPDIAKDKLKLREWCVARKDRKLFELQIEVCEWAITEIKTSDMGVKEKQRITTAIQKEIDGLAKSRVAIPCPASY